MSNEKYELLMREMDSIAKKLDRFPDSLKESAFKTMVEALLNEEGDEMSPQLTKESVALAMEEQPVKEEREDDMTFSDSVREFYSRANGSTCNDMEFSALSAYFFEKEAPGNMRRETIGPNHLARMCRITRRRVPANCRSTLNNAKNHKDYLESNGKGLYMLTNEGRDFVQDKFRQNAD